MPDEEQIKRAIAHLKAQKQPNIAAASTQFKVPRTTLSARFHGQRVSHEEATANTRLKLSSAQEKTLITYINKLSKRGLPPTPGIVRNLARELLKSKISEH
jgi:adenylate kinase family enzyme